jgi:hypothetical protein
MFFSRIDDSRLAELFSREVLTDLSGSSDGCRELG